MQGKGFCLDNISYQTLMNGPKVHVDFSGRVETVQETFSVLKDYFCVLQLDTNS